MTDKKLKILLWTDTFLPEIGGTEVVSNELIKEYCRLGHKVKLITAAGSFIEETRIINGVEVYRLLKQELYDMLILGKFDLLKKNRGKLAKIISSFDPDVFHIHTACGIYTSYISLMFKGLFNCPMLLILHIVVDNDIYSKSLILNSLFELADRISCVSIANAKLLKSKNSFIVEKIRVIHNGLPAPDIKIKPLPKKSLKILFVGRLVPQKGCDILLRAFKLVLEEYQDAKLTVAGDGVDRKKLEALAIELDLQRNIEFLGWVAPKKVPLLMNNSIIVVMPSRFEPFGLVALQTAQMSRPLIASKIDGLEEIVVDGETGLLVNCGDIIGFAEAIKKLLANVALATTFGENAKKHVEQLFSVESMTKKYLEVSCEMIKGKENAKTAIG